MSLRQQAAIDAALIIQNLDEFGWPITLTNPSGATFALVGLSTNIGQTIDPETGQLVSGMRASVALSLAAIETAGADIPKAVSDRGSKPWLVTFADIGGASFTYKVQETSPDRAIGLIVCFLENYRA